MQDMNWPIVNDYWMISEHIGPFEYGEKFRIRGFLQGPNGLRLQVVSIWATVKASGQTRFITLYPDKP